MTHSKQELVKALVANLTEIENESARFEAALKSGGYL